MFGDAFNDFSLLNGGLLLDFPAKFEELLDKLLFRGPEGGLVDKQVVPSVFLKIPVDLSDKLPLAKGDLLTDSRPFSPTFSPVVDEDSFAFKHLFKCSFTE